jgi:copper chaperone
VTVHTLTLTGLRCTGCGVLVDTALEGVAGVRRARTSVRRGRVEVTADDGVDPADLVAAVAAAGYRAELLPPGP